MTLPFERPSTSVVFRHDRPTGECVLVRRERATGAAVYELVLNGKLLMDTAERSSEAALAAIALARCAGRAGLEVLVGGLGFGFTLGAVLRDGRVSRAEVVELEPALVAFLERPEVRREIGAPDPRDPRVDLRVGEVGARIAASNRAFDAILLDVDNGPESLSAVGNGELYGVAGLSRCRAALRPGGVLAIWSSEPAPGCLARMRDVFGEARETIVPVERSGRRLEYRILSSRRRPEPVRLA